MSDLTTLRGCARVGAGWAQLEFLTGTAVDPDGALVCFAVPDEHLHPVGFTIEAVKEGGDQFSAAGEVQHVGGGTPAATSVFLTAPSTSWQHQPVEFGTVHHVLGTDPFYASSYHRVRYDDLQEDSGGNSLEGLVGQPQVGGSGESGLEGEYGNCVLVTGAWRAQTRYEMTFSMQNPAPPSMGSPTQNLKFWYAPVTYSIKDGQSGSYATYRIRGDKAGHVCAPRTGIQASEQTRLFDACQAAATLGILTGEATPEACLTKLEASPGIESTLPFPPFQGHDELPAAVSCPDGKALASRFGECVGCEGGQVQGGGTTCTCPENRRILQVGPEACGLSWGPTGQAKSAGQAAEEICTLFTDRLNDLYAGRIGDATVVSAYMDAFLDSAGAFLDREFLETSRESYEAEETRTDTRNLSPTRAGGIGTTCSTCDAAGHFDAKTPRGVKGDGKPFDYRFQALGVFRFIGFTLEKSGYPCRTLYIPKDPSFPPYGKYQPGPVCKEL